MFLLLFEFELCSELEPELELDSELGFVSESVLEFESELDEPELEPLSPSL